MKRRTITLSVLLLAALAVLVTALFVGWHRGQTYGGKSLSHWLDQLPSIELVSNGLGESIGIPGNYRTIAEANADESRVRRNISEARKALDAIGTNQLSVLVERLKLKDSRLKLRILPWIYKLGFDIWAVKWGIIDDADVRTAEWQRGQALSALTYLRSRARPAVPQLLELATNQDNLIRCSAWYALEAVAPDEFHKRNHPPIIQHDYGRP